MSFLTIDDREVSAMQSPVAHLFEHMTKPLSMCSPAMRQKFIDSGMKLRIRYTESNDFRCDFDHASSEIVFSTRFVEVLWVTSYLNAIYFHIANEKGALSGQIVIDPLQEPELLAAMRLFGRMFNAWQDSAAPQNWDDNLPRPNDAATKESWENVADELALTSVGYILFHEIAHAFLRHGPSDLGTWSIEQEKDADRLAVEWYFTDLPDPRDSLRVKRGLGVASALIAQVAAGMFLKSFGGRSHPPKWQRLDQVLRLIENDPFHPIFAFVSQLLPLYRSMSGGQFVGHVSENFLEAFDHFIEELSRLVLAHRQ